LLTKLVSRADRGRASEGLEQEAVKGGRDWLKMDQRCKEWRVAVNEMRAAVGRHQSACLPS